MKNERKQPLNSRLREARLKRGLSQQRLADLVGTLPVSISRWENGSHVPTPYFRQKLSEVFNKTPDDLGLVSVTSSSPQPQAQTARIWTVPITRNPFFTGREPLLALLHERLSTTRMAALTQAQALSGLGGIGKTQTAAEYAFRYGDEYAHVFWMRAGTRETIESDFVKLAQMLDLLQVGEQDQSQIVGAVKGWLSAHESWLLILDNIEDLTLVQELLPTRHTGYILLTTRDRAVGAIAASIEVEKLTPHDGTLLLLRWSKRLERESPLDQAQTADRAAAELIVKEMDGLPLGLIQAGAYIEETACSLADYLNLYRKHRKKLLARHSRLILDYSYTVATTWSLSFRQIEAQSSDAADVMRLCAFLAPDAIPEELLMRGIAELGTVSDAEFGDPIRLNDALGVLFKYSLLRRVENGNTHIVNIHRLVQIVLRDSMDQESRRTWAERSVLVVNAAFPEIGSGDDEKQHYYMQYYLPHVQECATLISQYHLFCPEAALLLFQAGAFLYVHGFYAQSQSFHQQALDIREQVFGPEHPIVAESLNSLAMLARNRGDYEQAEGFHRRALAIREKTLGPESPATARSLNDLGVLYRSQGKYEQAEPLLQRAITIREQALGPEKPDTLVTCMNLAKLYAEQGKYEQAERLLKQTLATGERVLEPEHPLIAHNLNLLARLSFEQGNYEQAKPLWERAFALIEKTFGPEHPATAERLDDLAKLYFAQGHFVQAQSLCKRALRICEKLLGFEHPDTIANREHLARIMSKIEEEQHGHAAPSPH